MNKNIFAAVFFLISAESLAGNGLYVTGFGVRSSSMGGADVAYSRDSTAVNINPAGLARLKQRQLDFFTSTFFTANSHADANGNNKNQSNGLGHVVGLAYAEPIENSPLTAGIGMFIQGGLGYVYHDLNTGYGNTDDTETLFSVIKLVPGVSWQATETLSLGVNLGIHYARQDSKFFPDTSYNDTGAPEDAFAGLNLSNLHTVSYNVSAGFQWQAADSVVVGLNYTSRLGLNLGGGKAQLDFTSTGPGKTLYRNASLSKFAFPQELSVGVAWTFGKWVITPEIRWVNYAKSLDKPRLRLRNPNLSGAPAEVRSEFIYEFHDQYIYSLGAAYMLNDEYEIYLGYNYGKNPVPERNLSPILPVVPEHRISAGLSYQPKQSSYIYSLGFEHEFPEDITYQNNTARIGNGAKLHTETYLIRFMLSKTF